MKIQKIQTNAKTWYDLKNPLQIKTQEGNKTSSKFYFNGFEEVYEIKMSDGKLFKFTGNHKLKVGDKWKQVSHISAGDTFNNGIAVVEISKIGIHPTMDMEVDEVHYYILENGVHSHNSSFILGQVSQSIEPVNSCYYVKDLAKGKFTYKNPYLVKLLEEKNQDTVEVWKSILEHGGSVQHLTDILTEQERDVFKTFGEISQKEIVIQAAQRQKYIDQGQSLNLMIPHDTKPKDVNELLIFGWEQGIKSFYYQRSISPVQGLARNILACKSCEG